MRYLKSFESIHNSGDSEKVIIRQYVSDIFSEVEENRIRVFYSKFRSSSTVKIGEYSDQVSFRYSDVSNEINHLRSYLLEEHNTILGDVEFDRALGVDVQNPFIEFNNLYYKSGRRLEGWEKLDILKITNIPVYAIALNFKEK